MTLLLQLLKLAQDVHYHLRDIDEVNVRLLD